MVNSNKFMIRGGLMLLLTVCGMIVACGGGSGAKTGGSGELKGEVQTVNQISAFIPEGYKMVEYAGNADGDTQVEISPEDGFNASDLMHIDRRFDAAGAKDNLESNMMIYGRYNPVSKTYTINGEEFVCFEFRYESLECDCFIGYKVVGDKAYFIDAWGHTPEDEFAKSVIGSLK